MVIPFLNKKFLNKSKKKKKIVGAFVQVRRMKKPTNSSPKTNVKKKNKKLTFRKIKIFSHSKECNRRD